MTSTMSLFCTFVKKHHGNDAGYDFLINKNLMICGLPRTYKLSKVALHSTIQLNTLIHVLPSFFLWVETPPLY
jgi:hypothetical protein